MNVNHTKKVLLRTLFCAYRVALGNAGIIKDPTDLRAYDFE
jgi:hypothetical protein